VKIVDKEAKMLGQFVRKMFSSTFCYMFF